MSETNAKQVLKLLKKHGFVEVTVRQNGDHHRFSDGLGHHVTLAYSSLKDTIPPKTYAQILKQMGLK